MRFNSYLFILLFLPLILFGYYEISKIKNRWNILFLVSMSLIFYLYAGIGGSILLIISILFNYTLTKLFDSCTKWRKSILGIGVILNISLLLRFKYLSFIIETINELFGKSYTFSDDILPLGISFITFQQLAYIIDCYKGEVEDRSFLSYLIYILFFPKLTMGPIVSPNVLISQFNENEKKEINFDSIVIGIRIFNIGLFKKVIIADTFASAVTLFFGDIASATALDSILIMLAYTLQIYFDFSGYSDMAIASAKMLNIDLPINFNSPYKSVSITEFWKRWHITLNKFFIKYVYVPLGGNRNGNLRTYINIMVVFLLSGVWHGANWTFVLWGILHGFCSVIERKFASIILKIPRIIRWCGTFVVINLLWLLFRSDSVSQWISIIGKMCSLEILTLSDQMTACFMLPEIEFIISELDFMHCSNIYTIVAIGWFIIALSICLVGKNTSEKKYVNNVGTVLFSMILFVWSLISLSGESTFLYFDF